MSIDRDKVLKQLAHVMNQAAEGEGNVARHRKAMAELERDRQDASLARIMLIYAEHVQTMNSCRTAEAREDVGRKSR